MPFIDFQELKKNHPIEDVADRLGLELKKEGKAFRGECPSGEGGPRALCITPSKGAWYSFALNKGGDAISLVQLVNDCDAKEAARFIAGEPLERPEKAVPKERSKPSEGFAPLDYIQHDHPAVDAIGLEPEIAEKIGAGYCPRGIYRGKIAWPIRLPDGTLIGYIAATDIHLPPKWSI